MNKGKRIMIADDDPGIVDAIEMTLTFEGYDVVTTLTGDTIISMSDNFPDLLLLDVWMSGHDGRDICKLLKMKSETSNIPVIMISASPELKRSATEAGADDFLEKPFNIDELLNKIELLIG
ncbi:response regulator receiver domain-containing protein [Mucilaginibacter gracilis]|uniref:Response regulator receiver domain-containing protein n=1 Tax=Mucilaginibacter gracilis TaxID=423350 RepID=A0A495J5C3_9SPHI|nr:response regulator transcription factor [Mucilaginibacter gracilis]RKR83608.1 response regulator receiver domain-containing protein [Mucilaginibacter gracilis]